MRRVQVHTDYPGDLGYADILRQMHQYDRALRVVAGISGPGAEALALRVQRGAHDHEAAARLLPPAARDDVAMRENRIAILHRLNRMDDIERLYRRADHRRLVDGDNGRGYRILVALARAFAAKRDPDAVIALLRDASDREPADGGPAHSWLLNAYLRFGRLAPARTLARSMAAADQHYLRRCAAGHALARIGDTDLARATLQGVVDTFPGYYGGHRRLVTLLRDTGDFAAAHDVMRRLGDVEVILPALGIAVDGEGALPDGSPRTLALAEHPLLVTEHALVDLAQFDGANDAFLDQAMARVQRLTNAEGRWVRARVLRARHDASTVPLLAAMVDADGPGQDLVAVQYAQACADAGEWGAAVTAFTAAIAADPGNREAHLGLVTVHALHTAPHHEETLAGDPADASATDDALAGAIRGLLDSQAMDVPILCMTAERLAQNGHYGYAQDVFDAALRVNPEHDLSHAGKIRAWSWARRFDKATEVLDRARAMSPPGEAPFTVELAAAMMLGDQGQLYAATEAFEKLHRNLEQQPPDVRNREQYGASAVWLATSQRWLSRHVRAEQVIINALEPAARIAGHYFSRACDLYDELGWNSFDRHDWARARGRFAEALRLDPRHTGSLRGMIQVHRALGDVTRAERWAKRAFRLHPTDPSLRCELAWLYGKMSDFDRAIELLDAARGLEIAHAPALEWRIIYLARQRRLDRAGLAAAEALRLRPEFPSILEAGCSVALRNREPEHAQQIAAAARQDRPEDVRFLLVEATVADQIGACASRIDHVRAELAHADLNGNPDALATHARLLRHQGNRDDARRQLNTPTSWDRSPIVSVELAELNLRTGDADAAIRDLKRLRQDVPWSWRIVRQLTTAMVNNGQIDAALNLAVTAVDQARADGDTCPVELIVLRGEVRLRANRFEEALGDAEEALRHPSRYGIEARILQVAVQIALGHLDEAVRLSRALQVLRPASRRVQLCLAKSLELVGSRREAAGALGDLSIAIAHDRPLLIAASWILRGIGEAGKAEEIMAKARGAMPNDAGVAVEHAWAILDQDRIEDARRLFENIVGPEPSGRDRARGQSGMGWCDLRESEPRLDDARRRFAGAVASDGQLAEAHIGLSITASLSADQSTSVEQRRNNLITAAKHAGNALNLDLIAANEQLYGRLQYRLGAYASALDHLRNSIRLNSYRGDRAGLAVLLIGNGDPDAAIVILLDGLAMIDQSSPESPGRERAGAADPTHPDVRLQRLRADLLAALGAAHLERDQIRGTIGSDTRISLGYLSEAVRLEPRHLYAVYHYAVGLTHLGYARKAEVLLRATLAAASPEAQRRADRGVGWVSLDSEHVVLLRRSLADILRQRIAQPGGRRARSEREQLLRQIARTSGDETPDNDPEPYGPANGVTLQRIGYVLTGLAIAALAALWAGWLTASGSGGLAGVGDTAMLGFTSLAVLAAFAGVILPRLKQFKFAGVEITTTLEELKSTITALDLPTRVPIAISFDNVDPTRIQWTRSWSSETRTPRLGPTVNPIVSSFYAQRDQFMPWRRI